MPRLGTDSVDAPSVSSRQQWHFSIPLLDSSRLDSDSLAFHETNSVVGARRPKPLILPCVEVTYYDDINVSLVFHEPVFHDLVDRLVCPIRQGRVRLAV